MIFLKPSNKSNSNCWKTGKLKFEFLFDSRFDISQNNCLLFGKLAEGRADRVVQNMVFSENVVNNKVTPFKPNCSEIFSIKLNRKKDVLFSGDFEGKLLEHDRFSQKVKNSYDVKFEIWSICFVDDIHLLVGGDEKICLINSVRKNKIKNVEIYKLDNLLSEVIYQMDFLKSDLHYKYPRIICKTSNNHPCVINLTKLLQKISKKKPSLKMKTILCKKMDFALN